MTYIIDFMYRHIHVNYILLYLFLFAYNIRGPSQNNQLIQV